MDENQISCIHPVVGDRLPPRVSEKHVWFVAQMLEAGDTIGDLVFYTAHDPLQSQYRCRVPELSGRLIHGCFHGWVIMSNHPHNVMWSLWNPSISRFITLPELNNGRGDIIDECCLTSPPDDPAGSILLVTENEKPTFVFCRLDKLKRWEEMSYAEQLKNIVGVDCFLEFLSCCNGKVYGLSVISDKCNAATGEFDSFVIEVNIHVVTNTPTEEEVVISLLPFVKCPRYSHFDGPTFTPGPFLKGSCDNELFIIYLYIYIKQPGKLCSVRLVKLDMNSKLWEEMEDFDDAACFIECNTIASKSGGGYIHMHLQGNGLIMYSYNVKDKTVAKSSSIFHCANLPPDTSTISYISIWAMPEHNSSSSRLGGDHGKNYHKEECDTAVEVNNSKMSESHRPYIPFHLWEMIMELCEGIDYVNFRATCKKLAAPMSWTQSSNGVRRLQQQRYSSPWLMVLDKNHGIITFTDPMFGDQYSVRTPPDVNGNLHIWFSMYGWLLMSKDATSMMLFNPFTGDIHKLPDLDHVCYMESFCFSAPPSSPDCIVVGFLKHLVFIHFVSREPATWDTYFLRSKDDEPNDDDYPSDSSPSIMTTFSLVYSDHRHIRAVNKEGRLLFAQIHENEINCLYDVVNAPASCCTSLARYYLVKHDNQDLLLVIVDEFGHSVELFKLNGDAKEWEKITGLGKHMIYICDTSCLCMEAKVPEMENKIYFAVLHSKNDKIVFYSLDTCRFHTFSGKSILDSFGNLFGTKEHLQPHVWIIN